MLGIIRQQTAEFQSTLPAWGETDECVAIRPEYLFQSTLPAWGETLKSVVPCAKRKFQSTLPAWGETHRAKHG